MTTFLLLVHRITSPSGVHGENITEAVPESAEETAEEVDLSMLVDISILSCKVPYAFTNFWGEPCYCRRKSNQIEPRICHPLYQYKCQLEMPPPLPITVGK